MTDVRLIDANALRQKIEKWAAEADNSISFVDSVEGFAYDEVLDAIDAAPTIDPETLRPVYCASGEVMCSVRNCPERTLKPCFKCKWHDNETMACSKRVSLITGRPCLYTDLNYTCAEWETADDIGAKMEDDTHDEPDL